MRCTRRAFWAVAALTLAACHSEEQPAVRNVILISVDSLRPDLLTPYDDSLATSPHLARFAEDAALFTEAVSQGASTAISHKSMLYSLYPWITGMTEKNKVPQEKGTSPLEALQAAGIFTGAIVGGGQLDAVYGFSRGFDTFLQTNRNTRREVRDAGMTLTEARADRAARRRLRTERLAAEREGRPMPELPDRPVDGEGDAMTPVELEPVALEIMEEDSMAWLDEHHQKPFFLFLHTYKVHCPYVPPPHYAQRFAAPYQGTVDASNCRSLSEHEGLKEADFAYLRQMYMGEIAYVDEFLGRLFTKLEDLGIDENTMIAFLADHGESFGEHGRLGHNRLDRSILRVPLIIKIPGSRGTRIDAPVELVDVIPTVFAALGVAAPYRFQGINLLPIINGEQRIDSDRTRFSSQVERSAVLKGGWKLVLGEAANVSLYDWRSDPRELQNVLEENPAVAAELREEFDKMLADGHDLVQNFVQPADQELEITDELREQLEALGYLDR